MSCLPGPAGIHSLNAFFLVRRPQPAALVRDLGQGNLRSQIPSRPPLGSDPQKGNPALPPLLFQTWTPLGVSPTPRPFESCYFLHSFNLSPRVWEMPMYSYSTVPSFLHSPTQQIASKCLFCAGHCPWLGAHA